jgi:hypothetical protein
MCDNHEPLDDREIALQALILIGATAEALVANKDSSVAVYQQMGLAIELSKALNEPDLTERLEFVQITNAMFLEELMKQNQELTNEAKKQASRKRHPSRMFRKEGK